MKILYLVTEDWFFCSHFYERAAAAVKSGFEVVVVANDNGKRGVIESVGIKFIPFNISRRGKNPIKELTCIFRICFLYIKERPDIVHHIAIKPILYGTFAAYLTKVTSIINAPVGLGYFFSSKDLFAKKTKPTILFFYKFLLNPKGSKVIFENSDDLRYFINEGIVCAADAILIKGAGVNLSDFKKVSTAVPSNSPPVICLIARMLKDKGVFEFLMAARLLNANGIIARFVLVGNPDPENPSSISSETLRQYHGRFGVEWWGWRGDVPEVLRQSYAVCLPSYREGLPKVLLEAAASSLPIITSDTVGCREVVIHNYNGLLVPVGDPVQLAHAIDKILKSPLIAETMGRNGRERVEMEFSSEIVIKKTLNLYHNLAKKSDL